MKKLISLLFTATLLFSIFTVASYAYEIQFGTTKFITYQYSLKLAYHQKGSLNHQSSVIAGMTAWNSSSARIDVRETSPNSGENILVESTNYGNTGWHGLCQPPMPLSIDTSFIKINDYFYSVFSGNTAELVAHEMGHSFRLKDIDNSYVLMRKQGYKNSPDPTQDDVDGVNASY